MPTTFDPAAFKADIYAGGVDSTQATKRGLEIAKQQGWSPVQTVNNWNQSLGTEFGVPDFFRALKESGMSGAGDFGQYMYNNGLADDKLATRRGLDYAQQVGWTPDETATNWNDALGTDFGVADLWAAAKGQDVPNDAGRGGGSYLISALRGFSPASATNPGVNFYRNPTVSSGTGMVRGAQSQTGNLNSPRINLVSGTTKPVEATNPTQTVKPAPANDSPLYDQLPDDWYSNYDAAEKIDWYNDNNVTTKDLIEADVNTADIQWMIDNGYTAGNAQESLIAKLPDDWRGYGASDKIKWYNDNSISANDLFNEGVPLSDIEWMLANGYMGGQVEDPNTQGGTGP